MLVRERGMKMTVKLTRRLDSLYTVPIDATGDERIYGTFTEQRILGYPCTIKVDEVSDNNPAVRDMLGQAAVMRGDAAIHISGLDPFGKKTGPGFIRAIGNVEVEFSLPSQKEDPPAGLGCRGPEVAVIVSWDSDEMGNGHRSDIWQHHSLFSGVDHWITLRGLLGWCKGSSRIYEFGFTPRDVCEAIDRIGRREGCMRTAGDRQHESAVRRLLETLVDVQNTKLDGFMLGRSGRWNYYFL